MRDNAKAKERFQLSLDARQALAVLVATLAAVAGVFVLGMSAGRVQAGRAASAGPKDALARLDEPLAPAQEPAPELKAHEALTAGKSIDRALPVQAVKAPSRRDEPPPVVEVSAPPQIPTEATAAPSRAALAQASTTASSPALATASKPPPAARATSTLTRTSTSASAATTSPHQRGAFTIQVASAPRRADAERVARGLASRGARVVAADLPGKGRWYRVQIGEYPSREAASRQLASLSGAGVQGIVTAGR
jgi:DedD protein